MVRIKTNNSFSYDLELEEKSITTNIVSLNHIATNSTIKITSLDVCQSHKTGDLPSAIMAAHNVDSQAHTNLVNSLKNRDENVYNTLSNAIPSSISNLEDDTATYPIDKADTLTDLTATVSELNYCDGVTSNIQTQLDAKLETDHSNDTKPYLKTTYVNGTSGYNIWSNGYCEQWGYITQSATNPTSVSFTKTYNAEPQVFLTFWTTSNTTSTDPFSSAWLQARSVATNGFSTFNLNEIRGNRCWRAFGYLAEGQY